MIFRGEAELRSLSVEQLLAEQKKTEALLDSGKLEFVQDRYLDTPSLNPAQSEEARRTAPHQFSLYYNLIQRILDEKQKPAA